MLTRNMSVMILAPDSRAVHLLVQRIEVTSDNEKTDFNVVSTLESVFEKLVRVEITDSAANDHVLFYNADLLYGWPKGILIP